MKLPGGSGCSGTSVGRNSRSSQLNMAPTRKKTTTVPRPANAFGVAAQHDPDPL